MLFRGCFFVGVGGGGGKGCAGGGGEGTNDIIMLIIH